MSEELKPCPFCGDVPTVVYGPGDSYMSHQCVDNMSLCMTIKQWNKRVPYYEGYDGEGAKK